MRSPDITQINMTLFKQHLDASVGAWSKAEAKAGVALAVLANRCLDTVHRRCVVAKIVDDVDAAAGRGRRRGGGGGSGAGGSGRAKRLLGSLSRVGTKGRT